MWITATGLESCHVLREFDLNRLSIGKFLRIEKTEKHHTSWKVSLLRAGLLGAVTY